MKPVLTRDLAHAAAWDEGNRSMRLAGRDKWSEDDYNAAVREFNRLQPFVSDHEKAPAVSGGASLANF